MKNKCEILNDVGECLLWGIRTSDNCYGITLGASTHDGVSPQEVRESSPTSGLGTICIAPLCEGLILPEHVFEV